MWQKITGDGCYMPHRNTNFAGSEDRKTGRIFIVVWYDKYQSLVIVPQTVWK